MFTTQMASLICDLNRPSVDVPTHYCCFYDLFYIVPVDVIIDSRLLFFSSPLLVLSSLCSYVLIRRT